MPTPSELRKHGACSVCKEGKDVRYIDLYYIGSEGTKLCHGCEMKLTNKLWELIREEDNERRRIWVEKRRIEQEIPANAPKDYNSIPNWMKQIEKKLVDTKE